jgi:predicted ester cyclase
VHIKKQKLTIMKNLLWTLFALILLAGTSCQNKQTTTELNELKAKAELEEQNKELVKNYFNELGNTESDELAEFVDKYISSDFVLHLPEEEKRGKDELVKHYVDGRAALPGAKQTIDDIIVQGNKVAFRGVLKAVLPNENEINFTFAFFWQIQDGKIVEWWSEFDALGMMQQLGMELKPVENKK